jgi:predicted RNase H-like HicB family nuclease
MHGKEKKEVFLRGFAYKKGGVFFACCLDLNLVSQGKTMDEAVRNLNETVQFYVKSEFKDGMSFDQIKRPAPFYFQFLYRWLLFKVLTSMWRDKITDHYRVYNSRFYGCDFFPVDSIAC